MTISRDRQTDHISNASRKHSPSMSGEYRPAISPSAPLEPRACRAGPDSASGRCRSGTPGFDPISIGTGSHLACLRRPQRRSVPSTPPSDRRPRSCAEPDAPPEHPTALPYRAHLRHRLPHAPCCEPRCRREVSILSSRRRYDTLWVPRPQRLPSCGRGHRPRRSAASSDQLA